MKSIRVHALEGSMVSTAKGIERLYDIHKNGKEDVEIYVLPPTRDPDLSFYRLLDAAENKDDRLWDMLSQKRNAWLELVSSVLDGTGCETVSAYISSSFESIRDILRAVWILEDKSGAASDHLETLTSTFLEKIVSAYFEEKGISTGSVEFKKIMEDHNPAFAASALFIAGEIEYCDDDKDAAGRERSDEGWGEYSAALVAAHLGAALTYWNQKSLLYSASKKDVPNAHLITDMTYAEATELSFFGAPVVHPHSFIPAEEAGIPLSLRYWGDPDEEGTLVTREARNSGKDGVKAFSVVKNISLINVEGSGMSGVPGVSSRLFGALRNEGISVIFISQASSEYSICFAVPKTQAASAKTTLEKEFSREISLHQISSIDMEDNLSILAVVGEAMPGRIGVAGKLFSSLARAGVNVRAIAQGSSERNISAVIASKDAVKAERALHTVFFMSQQTLSLGLFGPGNIGGTLLDQIGRESERLRREFDLDIRVRGIATSRKMLISEEGVDLSSWREQLDNYGIPYNEEIFLSHIKASYYPHWVLVDATA
ncbi:MAG: ACT domain-containing protein, partial [Candidatus Ornithospirochaeta sp.]